MAPKAAPKKKAAKVKKFAHTDSESAAAAQKYKPDIAGCVLSLESEWHCRWKISYPCLVPPFTTSAMLEETDAKDSRRALYVVLKWAWEQHKKSMVWSAPGTWRTSVQATT